MLLHLRFKLSTLCRQLEARRNLRRAFPLRHSFMDESDILLCFLLQKRRFYENLIQILTIFT